MILQPKRPPTELEKMADAKYRKLGLPPLPNIKDLRGPPIQILPSHRRGKK